MKGYRRVFILLFTVCALLLWISPAQGATIELSDGSTIEASVYVIRDGYHYLKIASADVSRVKYASRTVRHDVMFLRSGREVEGKITGFMDDYYYVQIPSSRVKSIMSETRLTTVSGSRPDIRDGLLFRIHGSNTIGAKLAPALVAAYFRSIGAGKVDIKDRKAEEVLVGGSFPGNSTPTEVEIQSYGSATAFNGLEKRACDIGAASRRITTDEAARLSSLGDLMSAKNEHILAIDGIAVIVHKNNPVFKITKKELQLIFSGELTDWARIGGRPGKINLYARDDKSGTYDTFKSLVLGKAKLASSARRYEDSSELSRDVSADPNGIGFIGLPYVLAAKALAVSDGAEPIPPDPFTIATEDYPLSRRLYLYTPANASKEVERFIEFALGEAGQKIVEQNGFVDLSVRAFKADVIADVSPAYHRMVVNASRLSVNFRFSKNSYQLDNKALRDLKRVAAYLNRSDNKGKRILLLGFTDSLGSFSSDQVLSEKRARSVQAELALHGITVRNTDVVGFSKLNPIVSNDTPEGREKNRRVEIWIRESGK